MAFDFGQELLIVFLLILANGFFAAAEIALIAARRGRLQQLADSGDRAAAAALNLSKDPERFLPTVQIGITIVGTLAAALGGAKVVAHLKEIFEHVPIPFVARHAENLGLTLVVVTISALEVLLGELVPKRLALQNATAFARIVALPIQGMVWLFRPVLWAINGICNAVLGLFGVAIQEEGKLRREDIEQLLEEGVSGGVINPVEREVAVEALKLGARTVKDVMLPRIDIDGIDVETPADEVLGVVAMAGFSRLPVYENDLDHIIGFVHVKDVLRQVHLGWALDLRKLLHPALFVPESLPLHKLLADFREHQTHLAVVLDEFGGTEGMVTLDAVVEELVGAIADEHTHDRGSEIVQRDERSWLVDGLCNVDEFLAKADLKRIKLPTPRRFSTMAGLVSETLGRLPKVGEKLTWQGLEIEVVDMDGMRIDRLLVSLPDNHADA
jgi:putative hemolysin